MHLCKPVHRLQPRIQVTEIRVLLADDHAVLRSGLKLLLQHQPDIRVVGEAGDGLEAINLATEFQPDVILLDLTMPGLGGLDALPSLRKITPKSKILILTMHDDESYLRRALKGGAVGYVLKKAADAEVISAIRAVARGELYVHSAMTRSLLDGLVPHPGHTPVQEADLWDKLSDREREVMRLVALGHTSSEIAELLSLSVKTIETYRARGMEKLELRSRAALVKYALARGLLND